MDALLSLGKRNKTLRFKKVHEAQTFILHQLYALRIPSPRLPSESGASIHNLFCTLLLIMGEECRLR